MDLTFLGQPEECHSNALEFVAARLRDQQTTHAFFATAWVHAPGVALLLPALREFRARGGYSTLICGLSRGGATIDGLEAARRAFDRVFVAFDPSGRTIHAKIYLLRGSTQSALLVGSQNLSRSGLTTGHEAGLAVIGDPRDAVFADAQGYVDRLICDQGIVRLLTDDVMRRLLVSDQVDFASPADTWESVPAAVSSSSDPLFTRSARRLRGWPSAAGREGLPAGLGDDSARGVSQSEQDRVANRWFKRNLKRSDARRPSRGSHPTNHLTLTNAGHTLDRRTWFRSVLFGDAVWDAVEDAAGKEHAIVRFEVVGLGGAYEEPMRVTHNLAHDSGQGNRTTSIEWGERTRRLLESVVDVRGRTLSLERFADGRYRITFAAAETGPFIP